MWSTVHERNRVAWLAVVVGAWLWVAPFALGYPLAHPFLRATLSDLVVGGVVMSAGWLGARQGDRAQGTLRVLVGCALWLLVSGLFLGYRSEPLHAAAVNDPVSGVVLLLISLLALLVAGRPAPARTVPVAPDPHPVLWLSERAGEPAAPFRGQASDAQERRARRSLGRAWAAVGALIVAAVLLAWAFVVRSLPLAVLGLLLGGGSAFAAVQLGVLADTTVGQSARGS